MKETNSIIAAGTKGDKVEPQTRNYFNRKQEVWRSSEQKKICPKRYKKKTSFDINTTKKQFIVYKLLKKLFETTFRNSQKDEQSPGI